MSDTFFLIVGIILSAIGVLCIASGIISKVRCTEPAVGTVVRLKDKSYYHRGITTHDITPIIKYDYNGKTYESKADTSTSDKKKFIVGKNVNVFVNPERPEEFKLGKVIFPYVFGAIMLIAGAVLILCYFL